MSDKNIPMPVAPPDQVRQQGIAVQSVQQELGISLDEISTARVAAVEEFLLNKQEEITAEIAQTDDTINKMIKEKQDLTKKWVEEAEEKAVKKIESAISKLSFKNILKVKAVSALEYNTKDGTDNTHACVVSVFLTSDLEKDTYYRDEKAIPVNTETVKIPAQTKKAIEKIDKEIKPLRESKKELQNKIMKISTKLANMDREERKAKSMLINSKVSQYENGSEFMKAITGNMPEI